MPLRYLPAYSPDLNPIENAFSKIKSALRIAAARICDNGSDRFFMVTPWLNRYWCFGTCQSGGDIIGLVAQAQRISKKDAAHLIAEELD